MTTPAGASMPEEDEGNEQEDLERLELPLKGVEPMFWRVLVAPVKPKSVTAGGIILSDQSFDAAQHLNYIGKVVAIGAGALKHERLKVGYDGEPPFELGDYIIYKRYAGLKLAYAGLRLLAINDDDILLKTDDPQRWKVLI